MALTFQPYPVPQPQEEENPYDRANKGIQNALGAYLQYQQQKAQSELAKQGKLIEYAKARAEYGDDFTNMLGQVGGDTSAFGLTPQPSAMPAPSAGAPTSPVGAPSVAPAGDPATAKQTFKSALDITPEHLAEIRKKKGTRGLKEFQDSQTFLTNEKQANAQIGQQTVTNETALRNDYMKTAQNFKVVSENIGNINSLANRPPSAAGDIALIFSYMKLNDPGSTVREGEFATAQNAAGVPDKFKAVYNSLLNGQKLAPAQREDFIRTSGSLYDGWSKKQAALDEQYRGIATRSNMNPENVVMNFGVPGQNLSNYRSPASKGPPNGKYTVNQGGHVYQWNEQTGAYE